jgi:hypothetical protein
MYHVTAKFNSSIQLKKCIQSFFLETINLIKPKLHVNDHGIVLFKIYIFCASEI